MTVLGDTVRGKGRTRKTSWATTAGTRVRDAGRTDLCDREGGREGAQIAEYILSKVRMQSSKQEMRRPE